MHPHTVIRALLLGLLFLSGAAPSEVSAQIGWQGSLSYDSKFVTRYTEPLYDFSIAIGRTRTPSFDTDLRFEPEFLRADFETNSITFVTRLYNNLEQVPISVDANEYLDYRMQRKERQLWRQNFLNGLNQARQSGGGSGLSVGVQLPKRFDKIFGEGGGQLRISGFQRIEFSGSSTWTDGAESDLVQQSRFPTLNMDQRSRFEVTGTIGTKITVRVNQDSQSDIPLSNRIQLRYNGDEDDILKKIEAGNTNLSIPNTRFVGYSQSIQGLFGVKAEAQLGNLYLTAIASQEKGSSESSAVTPGGEENARYVRDYQYAEGRVFDLGFRRSATGLQQDLGRNDTIITIQFFEQERNSQDQIVAEVARFFVDPTDPTRFETDATPDSIAIREVFPSDDGIRRDVARNQHYVHFGTARRDLLGVYMEVARFDDNNNFLGIDTIGDISQQPYRLKMLRASDVEYNETHPTWPLMWRNVYDVPRNLRSEDLGLKIFVGVQGREDQATNLDYQINSSTGQSEGNYLEIFGLDQTQTSGARIPDGQLDDNLEIYNPIWGLLLFPSRFPFNSDTTFTDSLGNQTPELASIARNPFLYNGRPTEQRVVNSTQFYLQLTSRERTNTIRLGRANIIEGSERVTVNGETLTKDVDYSIQYDFGQVTLLSDRALDPNGDLRIEFEYAPFVSIARKTLFGARADYEWNKDVRFGSTVLYKSDKAQDRKPRVGQETASGLVTSFDGRATFQPAFLTSAIDALPLITTEAPSSVTIAGEFAQSRPNPNVDGVAYVDDFESAIEQVSLGSTRNDWRLSSLPLQVGAESRRSKMLWHNPPRISYQEVFDAERAAGEGSITLFRMIFRKAAFVTDTTDTNPPPPDAPRSDSWSGITYYLGANRLDEDRLQLFEMRVRGDRGVINFDFGRISDDIDGDGNLDTEDRDLNQAVSEEEDVGLDGLPDEEEPGYDPILNPDPNGDNWFNGAEGKCPLPDGTCPNQRFADNDPRFYEWLNGTEGNRVELGLALDNVDSEVPRRAGGFWNQTNTYRSFRVDLSTGEYEVPGSRNASDWKTIRIPVREIIEESFREGDPTWDNTTHVRVWIESAATDTIPDTIEVARWYFVQSNWTDSLLIDSTRVVNPNDSSSFVVASVSEEDNEFFTPPPGVEAYTDPTSNVTEAQRALALIYENLKPNDTGLATKTNPVAESYAGYRRLQLFVYGPEATVTDSVFFFFRVGRDSVNYYETSTFLEPGWASGNEIDFDFNEVTAIKDSALRALDNPNAELDVVSGKYRIFGRPNINEVLYFAAGVVNAGSNEISGEIWMDEMRVVDVRRDVGTAYRVEMNMRGADLFTFNASLENRDAFFRGISSATRAGSNNNLGSGQSNVSESYSLTFQAHKLLPKSFGATLPISAGYSRTESRPLVRTNSDIVLPEEIRELEKTTSETRRFSVSESFNKRTTNPLFTLFLNRQKLSLSYARSDRRSVTQPFSFSENYTVRGDYDMSWRNAPKVPIFFWLKPIPFLNKAAGSTLQLYPERWNWSGSLTRTVSINDDPQGNRRSSLNRNFNARMNYSHQIFPTLKTSLVWSTNNDLADDNLVNLSLSDFRLGEQLNYSQNFSGTYDPKLFGWFTTSFSYRANYRDDLDRSNGTRRSDLSRSWSVNGVINHQRFFARGQSWGIIETPKSVIRFLTNWVRPPSYKYEESYTNTVPGLTGRPSLAYRFGLRDETNVPIGISNSSRRASEGVSYEASSGFTLLGGISTDVRYRQQIDRNLIAVGGRDEDRNTSWPDLTISIRRFQTLPLIKPIVNKFIDIFTPRTSYSRSTRETEALETGIVTSRVVTVNQTPLLALTLKLFRNFSLSGSYGTTRTTDEKFSRTSGASTTETRSTGQRIAVSTRWQFSAPSGIQIPLLGRLRFQSRVTFEATIRYNADKSESSSAGNAFRTTRDQTDFQVQPIIQYEFSRQIKGGLSGLWQDTNNRQLDRKTHLRQLAIWTEIRF